MIFRPGEALFTKFRSIFCITARLFYFCFYICERVINLAVCFSKRLSDVFDMTTVRAVFSDFYNAYNEITVKNTE